MGRGGGSIGDSDLAQHMRAVALAVLGQPNPHLSSKTELRFGSHGSISVDLDKGTFYDHEKKDGGGVLKLLHDRKGLANGDAFGFMRDELGLDIGEPEPPIDRKPRQQPTRAKIVATYDYLDEAGELAFQVVRLEPKTFRQRRPDPAAPDGWSWSVKGVRLVPYRLPELLEAIAAEHVVFVVEGEKDVENLAKLGVPATCNPMGAGKWPEHFREFFAGADVVVIGDNDDSGREHAAKVATSLLGIAARVRRLALPDLPPKGDVTDFLERGGKPIDLFRLAEACPDFDPDAVPFVSRYGATWFEDIGRRKVARDWVVKGVFGAGELSIFYGDPGCGKSFLALDAGLRLASAALPSLVMSPGWFGLKTKACGVVYIAPEGGRGLELRMEAWRAHNQVEMGQRLPFVLLPSSVDLRNPQGDVAPLIAEINALVKRMSVPLGLIVVDTLAEALAGGNENTSEDMGALIRNGRRIQKETNADAHLNFVHHRGKDEAKGPRGWSGLRAAVDAMIEVEKLEEGGNRWAVRKQKDGEEGAKRGFHLQQVSVGVDEDGDAITSCVVVPSETGTEPARSTQRRSKNLSLRAKIGLQELRRALVDFGEAAPSSLRLPYGLRVVRWEHWRRTLAVKLFEPGENPTADAVRKAVVRVGEELLGKGVIGRDDPYVWIVREPSSS